MIAFKCTKVNDIAALFGVSPQNLNGYLDRGTFINLIRNEASKRNIDLKWIETGVTASDEMAAVKCSAVAEPNADYPAPHRISPENSYHDTLVKKTITVLSSDSVFRRALDSNIEAFHEAVTIKERLANNEARLAQCVDQIELLKNEIEQLKGAQAKKAV